tara:strand:+ start:16 stop:462 length:447 start_codon:yes stop_codon:yes gene_type:complete
MGATGYIIFLLGILVGYAACVVVSRLFSAGKSILMIKEAEVNALEILSTSAEDRAGLRVWLEKAVYEIDERDGFEEAKSWFDNTCQRREEEMEEWQERSIANLKRYLRKYDNMVQWKNWDEAMIYLTEFQKARQRFIEKVKSKSKRKE